MNKLEQEARRIGFLLEGYGKGTGEPILVDWARELMAATLPESAPKAETPEQPEPPTPQDASTAEGEPLPDAPTEETIAKALESYSDYRDPDSDYYRSAAYQAPNSKAPD